MPTLSESLAGRVAILDLWPLSVAQRASVRPEIIAQLLTGPQLVLGIEAAPVTRHEYLQLACTGGFPEVVRRPAGRARSRWFSDYLRTVTQRDVRELKQIEQMERLPRFMRYLAAITAQEPNVAETSTTSDTCHSRATDSATSSSPALSSPPAPGHCRSATE